MSAGTDIAAEVHAALLEAATDTGQGEFIVNLLRSGAVNETTYPPTKGADVSFTFRAIQTSLGFMDLQGGNTETGDLKLMLSVGDTEPTTDDKISFDGKTYSIESVDQLAPAGVVLYWKVIARGGAAV